MYFDNKILIGDSNGEKVSILPKMANRHGFIGGATGTGKTVTLKVLAESFSDAGVPVFVADVKGDLAGMCKEGVANEGISKRINDMNLDQAGFTFQSYPTAFWDIYSKSGIPLRTTISEMGPILLSKLMNLTPAQSDVLSLCFKIADDRELLLLDTKDLKAMLQYIGENAAEFSNEYGNIPKQSVNTIIRHVVTLESQGAEEFFMEPAFNIADWFATGNMGKGMINILDCRQLVNDTTMYSVFLLWMLSELFETLPEIGDQDKPRMIFFFDEAHLLFKDITKALQEKIEQIVKLIRSKGVGIYFITQNPKDIPDGVLAQLGNKIQHALRAYTPADEKGIKAAAASFRVNPEFDTKTVLSELGTGEALISVLDEDGTPTIVKQCKILPPQSQMGPISDVEREMEIKKNNLYLKYINTEDRDSAYEFFQRKKKQDDQELEERLQREAEEKEQKKQEEADRKAAEKEEAARIRAQEREEAARIKAAEREEAAKLKAKQKEEEKKQRAVKAGVKSVAGTAAGTVGRELGNAVGKSVGGSFGKKLGGNLGASLGRSILGTFLK